MNAVTVIQRFFAIFLGVESCRGGCNSMRHDLTRLIATLLTGWLLLTAANVSAGVLPEKARAMRGTSSLSTTNLGPGDLDPSFGNGGMIAHEDRYFFEWVPEKFMVQPGGKIIAVMNDWWDGEAGLQRFNSNGTIDNTFGTYGIDLMSWSTLFEIQADGRILHAREGQIIRYSPDGALEDILVQRSLQFIDLILQPDGKIVTLGRTSPQSAILVSRFHSDGSPDLGFGANGTVEVAYSHESRMLLQTGGSLIVSAGWPAGHLVRLKPDGGRDQSFGIDGSVNTVGSLIHIQSDGKILVTRYFHAADQGYSNEIIRYTIDGLPDPSFGSDGVVTLPGYYASDLTVDSVGRLVIAVFKNNLGIVVGGIIRLDPNGTPDRGFGPDGFSQIGSAISVTTVKILDNHKILAGGIRYLAGQPQIVLAQLMGGSASSESYQLAGRVTTTSGRGITGVRVSVIDSTGNTRSVSTSSFGYFNFEDLPPGDYTLTSQGKRYRFSPRTISLTSSVTDISIIGVE
ncbi:hypothetical protein BH20ACI2_BH20ACI2_27630 [soil metagenome]